MKPYEDWLTQPDGLAVRLRALRAQAGLSGKELAARTGWAASKVSRLENGRQLPSADDLRTWAAACGAGGAAAAELVEQLGGAHAVHLSWQQRGRQGQAGIQRNYNQLVQDARLLRSFSTVFIPGLLQTPDYARRILTEMAGLHGSDPAGVEEAVATRLARQRFLYEPGRRFEFLLSEAVLRYLLPAPAVMRGQLDRLQNVIGAPNIWFGILPFGVPLATTPQNSFAMFDDVAIVETFVGETTHTGDEAVGYARAMERLSEQAFTGAEARRLLVRAADALPRA